MRVIVLFDLPVETLENKSEYRNFRKLLIKKGFLMLQQSVYCKLALNTTAAASLMKIVKENKPTEGLVQVLLITERQYSRMEYIVGENKSTILDSDDRLVIF